MAVAQQTVTHDHVAPKNAKGPWADAFTRLLKNPAAVVSMLFILFLLLIAILAEQLNPYVLQGFSDAVEVQPAYAKQTLADNSKSFGAVSTGTTTEGFVYWLGADHLGRDILSRTMYGARVSLAVAFIASAVSLFIGLVYGLVSGYAGGRVDDLMMRVVDLLYGLPIIIIVILLQVYFKALGRQTDVSGFVGAVLNLNRSLGGLLFLFVALGALNWLGMARIARGQTLSYKRQEFVEAAEAVGATPRRILFTHLLPNILGPCIVAETLAIPGYILTEAFLSFIGLGVDPPTASWGIMLNESYKAIRSSPHMIVGPAVALSLTVLAFNFLGDGLRDVFDPRMRE
ncbi:MAG: ABC transporter permease [Anaerolineales bacterium]|nr:ABC transporter permease [Anaerolineales bacterium]MCB9128585.1 ABC transporter permease [Ardenticatenales bacterium]MCB9172523.1 ABC transporter permease [Ardenticatenales bacterium]